MDRHVSSQGPAHPTSPTRRHSRPSTPSIAHHRDSQQPYPPRERSREREQGFTREPPRAPRAHLQQTNPSPGPAPPGFGSGPPSAGFGPGGQFGHRGSYSSASGGAYHQGMNRGGPPPLGPRVRASGVSPTNAVHPQGPGRGAGSPVDDRGRDYRARNQGPEPFRQGRPRSPGWDYRGPGPGRREGFPPDAGYPRGRSRERYHDPPSHRPRSREREFQRAPRSRSRERDLRLARERERSRERAGPPVRRGGNPPGGYGMGYYDRDPKRGPPDAEWARTRDDQRGSLDRDRPHFRDSAQSPPPPAHPPQGPPYQQPGPPYQNGPGAGGPPASQYARQPSQPSNWAPGGRRGSNWGAPLQSGPGSDQFRDRPRDRDFHRRPDERHDSATSPTSPPPSARPVPGKSLEEQRGSRAPSAPPANIAIPAFTGSSQLPLSAPPLQAPPGPRIQGPASQAPPTAPTGPRSQTQRYSREMDQSPNQTSPGFQPHTPADSAPIKPMSLGMVHPDRIKVVEEQLERSVKEMSPAVSASANTGEGAVDSAWAIPSVPSKGHARQISPSKSSGDFRNNGLAPSPVTPNAVPVASSPPPPPPSQISPTKIPTGPKAFTMRGRGGGSFRGGRGGPVPMPVGYGRGPPMPSIKREFEDDRRPEWGRSAPPTKQMDNSYPRGARQPSVGFPAKAPSEAPTDNASVKAESEADKTEEKPVPVTTPVVEKARTPTPEPKPEPAVPERAYDEDSDEEDLTDDVASQIAEIVKRQETIKQTLEELAQKRRMHEQALKQEFVEVPEPKTLEPEPKMEMEVEVEEKEEVAPEPEVKTVEDEDGDAEMEDAPAMDDSGEEEREETKAEVQKEPTPPPVEEIVSEKQEAVETSGSTNDEDVEMTRAPTPETPSENVPHSPDSQRSLKTAPLTLIKSNEDMPADDEDELMREPSLPFFNPGPQKPFDQMDFFRKNLQNHERMKPLIVARMKLQSEEDARLEEQKKAEYVQLYTPYISKIRELEHEELRKKRVIPEIPEPIAALVQTPGTEGPPTGSRRGGRGATGGDVVRSEAEMEQVIRDIQEKEEQEKTEARLKAEGLRAGEAIVPDMILSKTERDKTRYKDYNNMIRDKSTIVDRFRLQEPPDDWTEEEQKLFIERYVETPKQWGQIAKGIPNRDFRDCILHYYRTKKEANYKAQVGRSKRSSKRGGKGKGRGRAPRTNALTAELARKDDEDADSEDVVQITESGRPKRAAAPVFGNGEVQKGGGEVRSETPLPATGKRAANRKDDEEGQPGERQSKRTRGSNKTDKGGRRGKASSNASTLPPIVPPPAPQQMQTQHQPIVPDSTTSAPAAVGSTPHASPQKPQQTPQSHPKILPDGSPIRDPMVNIAPQSAAITSPPVLQPLQTVEHVQPIRQMELEKQRRVEEWTGWDDNAHLRPNPQTKYVTQPAARVFPVGTENVLIAQQPQHKTTDLLDRESDAVSVLAALSGGSEDGMKVKQEEGPSHHFGGQPLAPSVPHTPTPGHQSLPMGQGQTPKKEKGGTSSSYWSVQETSDFPHLLHVYGTQWNLIAEHFPLKTTVMVRNYFTRQVDNGKPDWRDLAEAADRRRQTGHPPPPLHKSVAATARKKEPTLQSRPTVPLEIREEVQYQSGPPTMSPGDRGVERVERMERVERPDRTEIDTRVDRVERIERIDSRVGRGDRSAAPPPQQQTIAAAGSGPVPIQAHPHVQSIPSQVPPQIQPRSIQQTPQHSPDHRHPPLLPQHPSQQAIQAAPTQSPMAPQQRQPPMHVSQPPEVLAPQPRSMSRVLDQPPHVVGLSQEQIQAQQRAHEAQVHAQHMQQQRQQEELQIQRERQQQQQQMEMQRQQQMQAQVQAQQQQQQQQRMRSPPPSQRQSMVPQQIHPQAQQMPPHSIHPQHHAHAYSEPPPVHRAQQPAQPPRLVTQQIQAHPYSAQSSPTAHAVPQKGPNVMNLLNQTSPIYAQQHQQQPMPPKEPGAVPRTVASLAMGGTSSPAGPGMHHQSMPPRTMTPGPPIHSQAQHPQQAQVMHQHQRTHSTHSVHSGHSRQPSSAGGISQPLSARPSSGQAIAPPPVPPPAPAPVAKRSTIASLLNDDEPPAKPTPPPPAVISQPVREPLPSQHPHQPPQVHAHPQQQQVSQQMPPQHHMAHPQSQVHPSLQQQHVQGHASQHYPPQHMHPSAPPPQPASHPDLYNHHAYPERTSSPYAHHPRHAPSPPPRYPPHQSHPSHPQHPQHAQHQQHPPPHAQHPQHAQPQHSQYPPQPANAHRHYQQQPPPQSSYSQPPPPSSYSSAPSYSQPPLPQRPTLRSTLRAIQTPLLSNAHPNPATFLPPTNPTAPARKLLPTRSPAATTHSGKGASSVLSAGAAYAA